MRRNIYFLIIIILILLGVFLLFKGTKSSNKPSTLSTKPPIQTPAPLHKEVTITLNKSVFSPKEVTIKAGTSVSWKNESGAKQTVNSDDYPTNLKYKEL